MKTYNIYAKRILNNPSNDFEKVCTIDAKSKSQAISKAIINNILFGSIFSLDKVFATIS